jgi:hypothetical protein
MSEVHMDIELTAEQRADWERTMHHYMSSISERSNCTQWDTSLCPSLISAVEDIQKNKLPASRVGGFWISAAEAEVLQFMVDKLGYWWDYSKPYDPADHVDDEELTPLHIYWHCLKCNHRFEGGETHCPECGEVNPVHISYVPEGNRAFDI